MNETLEKYKNWQYNPLAGEKEKQEYLLSLAKRIKNTDHIDTHVAHWTPLPIKPKIFRRIWNFLTRKREKIDLRDEMVQKYEEYLAGGLKVEENYMMSIAKRLAFVDHTRRFVLPRPNFLERTKNGVTKMGEWLRKNVNF